MQPTVSYAPGAFAGGLSWTPLRGTSVKPFSSELPHNHARLETPSALNEQRQPINPTRPGLMQQASQHIGSQPSTAAAAAAAAAVAAGNAYNGAHLDVLPGPSSELGF